MAKGRPNGGVGTAGPRPKPTKNPKEGDKTKK